MVSREGMDNNESPPLRTTNGPGAPEPSAPSMSATNAQPTTSSLFAPGPANDPQVIQPGASLFSPNSINPISLPVAPSVPHKLWSSTNGIAFLLLIGVIVTICYSGMSTLVNIQHIKDDWANQRCSPLIMPFAGIFGYNTKDNFEFCMGKIFSMHSAPSMGSMGSIFGGFTSLLSSIFDSINSMRNTIATLGGGINVVFQEFTDRITMFFFTLRMSAIRLKMLFGRIYAILFSVMYMGMSGITGMSSFTNTYLFSFLDTFCFPGSTELRVLRSNEIHRIPIKDIIIGDILMPGKHAVTATFSFYARGQPMVTLGSTTVSTNHYVQYQDGYCKAGDHPHAIPIGPWNSDEFLYCLNTSTNHLPVGLHTFLDYDETSDGDEETMRMIEQRINGVPSPVQPYLFTECGFALQEDARIRTKHGITKIKEIRIGDQLSTGSYVAGVIHKKVTEVCIVDGIQITPSTLFWNGSLWVRYGEQYPIHRIDTEMISLVVTPTSQIELENGIYVRDYMELCSPDAEMHYTTHIKKKQVR